MSETSSRKTLRHRTKMNTIICDQDLREKMETLLKLCFRFPSECLTRWNFLSELPRAYIRLYARESVFKKFSYFYFLCNFLPSKYKELFSWERRAALNYLDNSTLYLHNIHMKTFWRLLCALLKSYVRYQVKHFFRPNIGKRHLIKFLHRPGFSKPNKWSSSKTSLNFGIFEF